MSGRIWDYLNEIELAHDEIVRLRTLEGAETSSGLALRLEAQYRLIERAQKAILTAARQAAVGVGDLNGLEGVGAESEGDPGRLIYVAIAATKQNGEAIEQLGRRLEGLEASKARRMHPLRPYALLGAGVLVLLDRALVISDIRHMLGVSGPAAMIMAVLTLSLAGLLVIMTSSQ